MTNLSLVCYDVFVAKIAHRGLATKNIPKSFHRSKRLGLCSLSDEIKTVFWRGFCFFLTLLLLSLVTEEERFSSFGLWLGLSATWLNDLPVSTSRGTLRNLHRRWFTTAGRTKRSRCSFGIIRCPTTGNVTLLSRSDEASVDDEVVTRRCSFDRG